MSDRDKKAARGGEKEKRTRNRTRRETVSVMRVEQ